MIKIPKRPPKLWMHDCVEHVSEHSPNVSSPGAVCGSLWYYKMSDEVKAKILAEEKSRKRIPKSKTKKSTTKRSTTKAKRKSTKARKTR